MRIRCICGQKYNIKDELAGQYARCRKCGDHMLVHPHDQPLPATPTAPMSAPVTSRPPAPQPTFDQGLDRNDPNFLGGLTDSQMSMGPAQELAQAQATHFRAKRGIRKPISKHAKLDFSFVNFGLKLIFAGITLGLGCTLFASVFQAGEVATVAGLLLFGAFLGHLLAMIGYIFCIWVPSQTEARPLIIAATICNAILVLVALASALVTASNPGDPTPLFDFISFLVNTGTVILFLLFLKKVSLYVGDTNAAENAWSLLIFFVAVGGIAALFMLSTIFIIPLIPGKLRFAYVLIGVLTIIIVLVIWLLHFLQFVDDLEFRKAKSHR